MPPRRARVAPEPGSLVDILNKHNHTSLFNRPICWTDQHSRLLGLRFSERKIPDAVRNMGDSAVFSKCPRPCPNHKAQAARVLESMLKAGTDFCWDFRPVHHALDGMFPDVFTSVYPDLHIRFGNKVYRDVVRVQLLWNTPKNYDSNSFDSASTLPSGSFGIPNAAPFAPSRGDLPLMAYLGRSQVSVVREHLFRVMCQPGKPNEPVSRLRGLRSKLVTPLNPDHDAHLAGIFLAMAQKHFYDDWSPTSSQASSTSNDTTMQMPHFHPVKLRILMDNRENSEFIMYTATVTPAFLRLFHNPRRSTAASTPGITIEYAKIPFSPVENLRVQLGYMIGADVVGELDGLEPAKTDEKSDSLKRRRELLEVFNRSFDEDTLEPRLMSPKRRYTEENVPAVGSGVVPEVGHFGL